MTCMLETGLCILGGPFNLVCLSHHHEIHLLVVKHEHLHLACVLLVGRGLAGCTVLAPVLEIQLYGVGFPEPSYSMMLRRAQFLS